MSPGGRREQGPAKASEGAVGFHTFGTEVTASGEYEVITGRVTPGGWAGGGSRDLEREREGKTSVRGHRLLSLHHSPSGVDAFAFFVGGSACNQGSRLRMVNVPFYCSALPTHYYPGVLIQDQFPSPLSSSEEANYVQRGLDPRSALENTP